MVQLVPPLLKGKPDVGPTFLGCEKCVSLGEGCWPQCCSLLTTLALEISLNVLEAIDVLKKSGKRFRSSVPSHPSRAVSHFEGWHEASKYNCIASRNIVVVPKP